MKQIVGNDRCQGIIRMDPQAFLNLCIVLRDQGGFNIHGEQQLRNKVQNFFT